MNDLTIALMHETVSPVMQHLVNALHLRSPTINSLLLGTELCTQYGINHIFMSLVG